MAPRPSTPPKHATAVRLHKAADDREAEPSAWALGAARAALERLEDRKEVFRRQADSLVRTATMTSLPSASTDDGNTRARARELIAFSSRLTSARSIWPASTSTTASDPGSETVTRLPSSRVHQERAHELIH